LSSVRHELRALVVLAAPISLAQLLLVGITLVDTSVLGRVSVEDLAGASIGRSIGFACMCVGMGVAMGLEPLASQALGAGERARAWRGYVANLRTGLLVWGPTVLASFAVTFFLPLVGVEAPVVTRARWYLLGQAPGMGFSIAFLTTKTFLQSHGKTAPALLAACVANATNVVIVNLLVRGDDALRDVHLPALGFPRLGALGGGLAFSISDLVLFSIAASFARRFRVEGGERIPARTVWTLGAPIGLQLLAEIGVFTAASLLAGHFGAKTLAAHQIALGLATFTYMGALGISGATAVRVGLAVGAGESARRRGLTGILLGAAIMSAPALLFTFAPDLLTSLFTKDPEVKALAATLLRIAALFQLFDGMQGVASGALRGAGDVRFAFVANVLAHWGFGLPLALTLAFGLGMQARGLWWGLTGGLVAVAVTMLVRFARISRYRIARV
jgi:MATE family multidrug resistance protein